MAQVSVRCGLILFTLLAGSAEAVRESSVKLSLDQHSVVTDSANATTRVEHATQSALGAWDRLKKISKMTPPLVALRSISGGFIQTSSAASVGTKTIIKTSRFARGTDAAKPVKPEQPKEMTLNEAVLQSCAGVLPGVALALIVAIFYGTNTNRIPMGEKSESQTPLFTDWSSGLCGCFEDMESCCCAMCCYPVRAAMTLSSVPGLLVTFWSMFSLFMALHVFVDALNGIALAFIGRDWEILMWQATYNSTSFTNSTNGTGFELQELEPALIKFASESGVPVEHSWIGQVLNFLSLLSILIPMLYRQKLRQAFHMQSGGCTIVTDCLAHWCCSCCAVAQEARHVEKARRAGHEALVGGAVGVI